VVGVEEVPLSSSSVFVVLMLVKFVAAFVRVFVSMGMAVGRSDVYGVPTTDNSDCAGVLAMSSGAFSTLED
jgi:hypothetical protein